MDDRFSPLRMAAVNAQLDTATGTVQTDREPRAFLSGLARRAGMTNHHPGEGAVDLRPFLHAPAVITIAALLAFFVHSLVARSGTFRILRRRSALVSLFTTGFAGIAAQVVIVHVFAATFGGLYRHIAWIFGLYMAGLAAGALAGSRWTGPKAAIAADWFVLVLLIAMGTVWAPHPGPAAITGAVTLLAGAATGFPFPVLFRAWRASSDLLPSTAAATAADYLGAAAGALAVSLTLLPVLGPAWTCVLVAAFKLPTLRLAIQSPPD